MIPEESEGTDEGGRHEASRKLEPVKELANLLLVFIILVLGREPAPWSDLGSSFGVESNSSPNSQPKLSLAVASPSALKNHKQKLDEASESASSNHGRSKIAKSNHVGDWEKERTAAYTSASASSTAELARMNDFMRTMQKDTMMADYISLLEAKIKKNPDDEESKRKLDLALAKKERALEEQLGLL